MNWSQTRQFPEERVCTRNLQESTLNLHTVHAHVRKEVTTCSFLLQEDYTVITANMSYLIIEEHHIIIA